MEYMPEPEETRLSAPEPKRTRREASLCAFSAVFVILLSNLLLIPFMLLMNGVDIDGRMYANLTLIVNLFAVDLVAMPLAWLIFLRRIPKDEAAGTGTRTPLSFRRILFYLPCTFVLMYAGALTGKLIGALLENGLSDVVGETISSVDLWVSALCAGILGPIAEELFFRKAMIDRLSAFHPTDAILFSSLLFALIHGNIAQFLYAFPLGVLFGIIYYRTQNIGYTIVLHIIVNMIGGVVSQLVSMATDALSESAANIVMLLYMQATLALCVVGVIFLIRRRRDFLPIPSDVPRYRRPFYLNAGFIVACVFFTALFILSEITI